MLPEHFHIQYRQFHGKNEWIVDRYQTHTFAFAIVLFTAGCPAGQPAPGGTTADLTLQRDVTGMIMLFDAAVDKTCDQRRIVNTVRPDRGTPVERWTVERCGKLVDYHVKYAPAPQGGTSFAVSLEDLSAAQADDVMLAAGKAAFAHGNYATALTLWRPLAEKGVPEIQYYLAGMYELGRGVPRDHEEALKWLRAAAEQEHSRAQNDLGVRYENGRGVPRDYAEALKWYRRAAERGHALAQNSVGALYGKGYGVPQNLVEAHMWFDLAVSRLPPGEFRDISVRNQKLAASLMTPAQISQANRLAREWREAHPNLPPFEYGGFDLTDYTQ